MSDDRIEPMPDLVAVDPDDRPGDAQTADAEDNRPRWIVWLLLLVGLTAAGVLRQVTTNLGAEAPAWDRSGREYVWRVWWRARDNIVDIGPGWAFTSIYVALALAFIVLSALAVWVALVPNERSPRPQETQAADLSATR